MTVAVDRGECLDFQGAELPWLPQSAWRSKSLGSVSFTIEVADASGIAYDVGYLPMVPDSEPGRYLPRVSTGFLLPGNYALHWEYDGGFLDVPFTVNGQGRRHPENVYWLRDLFCEVEIYG